MNSLCQMGEKKNRDKLVARFFYITLYDKRNRKLLKFSCTYI